MLEEAGCPYQGAGPKASFLALNKSRGQGRTRKSACARRTGGCSPASPAKRATFRPWVTRPLFVKPNRRLQPGHEPAAPEDFAPALDKVPAPGQAALVEACVPGLELTCAVLDDRALPVIPYPPARGHGVLRL